MNSAKNLANLFSELPVEEQRDSLIYMLSSLGNELTTIAAILSEKMMEEENEES